jgi:hypothetical protein
VGGGGGLLPHLNLWYGDLPPCSSNHPASQTIASVTHGHQTASKLRESNAHLILTTLIKLMAICSEFLVNTILQL